MGKIKKTLPKIKKSLKDFLTDESGKITKKNALGIGAGALIFAGIEDAMAAPPTSHVSGSVSPNLRSTYTEDPTFPVKYDSEDKKVPYIYNFVEATADACNHASGIVNGHFSAIPSVNPSNIHTHSSHNSY